MTFLTTTVADGGHPDPRRRVRRLVAATLAALLLVGGATGLAAQEWTEVRSPHFRVVTDRGARTARSVALDLERIRQLLSDLLPLPVSDPLRPVVVLVVEGGDALAALLPRYDDGPRPGGIFRAGAFTHHMVVREEVGPQGLYHEYFHLLTRLNARQLPIWLNEGLAEFWSNADFTSRTVRVGQPSVRALRTLYERWFPLRTLLGQTTNPHEGNERDIAVFYAQSWAVTHYLLLGDAELAERDALGEYLRAVERGRDPVATFEQVVGDIEELDDRLRGYTRQVRMSYLAVTGFEFDLDDRTFPVRDLPEAEALALRAGVIAWGGAPARARAMLDAAHALDPESAVVHEATGLFHYSRGDRTEAAPWFARAVALGSDGYAAHYLHARLTPGSDAAARLEHLQRTTALNPRFAPAFLEQAQIHSRQDEHARAVAIARYAINLEPSNTYAWATLASFYLVMEQPDAARDTVAQGRGWALTDAQRAPLDTVTRNVDRYVAVRAEALRRLAPGHEPARLAETPVGRPDPPPDPPAVAPSAPAARTVAGTWSELRCVADGLDFVVRAEGATYVVHADAPEPVQILDDAGDVQEEIFCGTLDRQVIVAFAPRPDAARAPVVRGDLLELRFP